MREVVDRDSDNPRLQCENCGKWRRLYDTEGEQLNFPLEGWLIGLPEIHYDSLCIWCHLLFGVVCEPFKEVPTNTKGHKE